jgi:Na+-transporting NADH:ubiquinone oxidoreductase subunit NqrC
MENFSWSKIILIVLGILLIGGIIRQCNTASEVANKEFNANALLKKYEYFKDVSAAIDKKRADIEMYKSEIATYKVEDKTDKEYVQQRKAELIGIISEHNNLCSEYNSAMSKFNYRFCNKGTLPETNLEPLPREIKPYINSIK